jgi:hypothetical protein
MGETRESGRKACARKGRRVRGRRDARNACVRGENARTKVRVEGGDQIGYRNNNVDALYSYEFIFFNNVHSLSLTHTPARSLRARS